MDRNDSLEMMAIDLERFIRIYGRRKDISVTFCRMTDESINEFSAWNQKRVHLLAGDEYFFVWENRRPDVPEYNGLLYVIDVTADSLLTAASEFMDLAYKKF